MTRRRRAVGKPRDEPVDDAAVAVDGPRVIPRLAPP